uniref:Uncharacterized protein n=1 Tax=Mycolicibacterium gilvum (strain PYR-GCK) TaxID=350054 RepID=A4T6J2_MYCGI|nr:hypothetical protein Mflv_1981 [Mycolicibacterium gilvum PYR-GCK]
MTADWDPRQEDEYADYLRAERLAQAAQADARRLEAAAFWTPPPYPPSAYDQLTETPPEVDWIVRDLWVGNAQVNAQKKSGKTTLLMNAAVALLTGQPFLGQFEVNVDSDCRVGYLNMELTKGQFNRWLREMDVPDDATKRLELYHGRELGRLDLANDVVAEWLIRWLRETGVSVLLMDPLGSFYDQPSGGDPNAAYLRWWACLERVVLEAGLRGVLIAHHAGYSEEGGNRARGASAMMDKPDVNLTYRYNVGEGSHTDAPVDTKRYLSAFGRDVDIHEFELEYSAPTRLLTVTGRGGRVDAELERQAERMRDAVLAADAAGRRPNKGELFAELGWDNTGRGKARFEKWYRYTIDQKQYVATEPGKGNERLHVPGDGEPTWRFRLDAEGGEVE